MAINCAATICSTRLIVLIQCHSRLAQDPPGAVLGDQSFPMASEIEVIGSMLYMTYVLISKKRCWLG